jgi:hypothetical protein
MRHARPRRPFAGASAWWISTVAALLVCTTAAEAQPPTTSGMPVPRLFSVTPPGAKAGSTVEINFTGQDVEDPEGFLFSHPGLKAEFVIPPWTQEIRAWSLGLSSKFQVLGSRIAPPITRFKVTAAANTPLGNHDVRVINKWGVSNPRAFVVGDLQEIMEKEPNDDVPQAQRVPINSTVNGIISSPVDVDYYVFSGQKGQRVIISCLATSIDSRLLAAIDVFDSTGTRLATSRHYHNEDALADVTLKSSGDYYVRVYEYTHVEGSPEHFYRLTISTAPWIDAVVPPMVEPGKTSTVTVYGRNLPGGEPVEEGGPGQGTGVREASVELRASNFARSPLTTQQSPLQRVAATIQAPGDAKALHQLTFSGLIAPKSAGLCGFEYRIHNAAGASNPFLMTYATAPVILDSGAHDSAAKAQPITSLPCEIAGQIERRHDRDWYLFSANKNDVYSIEALSDRLAVEEDIYMEVHRADNGQMLAEVDDNTDVLTPIQFFNQTQDPPVYRFVAPETGKYLLLVSSRDADTRASPCLYYRVRIGPEKPDFRVIIMPPDTIRPDGCCLHQGGRELYTVLIERLDGWTGPVTLSAEGLPSGVTCLPQVVGPNLRRMYLVLTAEPQAPMWTGEIRVKGAGVINGQTVVREARPASITWPVPPGSFPAVSRLDRNLVLAVRGKAAFDLEASLDKSTIQQGGKVNVTLRLARLWADNKAPLQVGPIDPAADFPPNLSFNNNNQPITIAADKKEAKAVLEVRPGVPPGTYNVVLRGTAQIPFNKSPVAKDRPPIPIEQPSSPLMLTVLPKK